MYLHTIFCKQLYGRLVFIRCCVHIRSLVRSISYRYIAKVECVSRFMIHSDNAKLRHMTTSLIISVHKDFCCFNANKNAICCRCCEAEAGVRSLDAFIWSFPTVLYIYNIWCMKNTNNGFDTKMAKQKENPKINWIYFECVYCLDIRIVLIFFLYVCFTFILRCGSHFFGFSMGQHTLDLRLFQFIRAENLSFLIFMSIVKYSRSTASKW